MSIESIEGFMEYLQQPVAKLRTEKVPRPLHNFMSDL